MREIKFRVWDKSAKLYTYNPNFLVVGNSDEERFHFQQYTGLKDKNNQGIYEGDLIQGTVGANKGTRIYVVVFYKGAFLLKWRHTYTQYDSLKNSQRIIGNIYENPEITLDE